MNTLINMLLATLGALLSVLVMFALNAFVLTEPFQISLFLIGWFSCTVCRFAYDIYNKSDYN